MGKLRVGIIGCGSIANFHAKGYKELEDKVEIVACSDVNAGKLMNFAKKWNISAAYTNCYEMLAAEHLDCVSVCTWNAMHKSATVAALRSGANVICEKPMALNAEQAKEMMDVAKETGKLLQIGFVRRFGNDADVIKKFAANGTFGDIYYAKAQYLRRNGCPGGWFGDKRYSGGGPLIDLGVHVIDLVRYLAGNPKPVSVYGVTYKNLGLNRASGGKQAWTVKSQRDFDYSVEDFANAMIRFENGLTLNVEASFNLNLKEDVGNIELYGTKAGAKLSPEVEIYTDLAGMFVDIAPSGSTALSFDGLFEREIAGFIDAVNGDAPCIATAEDGYYLMKILDGIYKSAETGHEVMIED